MDITFIPVFKNYQCVDVNRLQTPDFNGKMTDRHDFADRFARLNQLFEVLIVGCADRHLNVYPVPD